ncbi:hypothetical protein RHMOL_Rhmol04G0241000 [Rhododendron molle]|uniref:Uncharacterized protein n=1 Tax=Rhododendron molle TaxID=49168 RepID=A0ACC0P535_RHOML|nr:hypothetical protein RHMOL_Rhmol04G0241000 [Rhododendron molle]
MGKQYCDSQSRLKKKFEKGTVDCPAHIEGADWGYLSNLWQDKDYQDQAMANGSVPLIDEELSCTVFGPKSGYMRGLGHGPKPCLTKYGQTSWAQLIRDAEKARKKLQQRRRSVRWL